MLDEVHDRALHSLVKRLAPETIHEIGCGDGRHVLKWNRAGIDARGSDASGSAVDGARDRALAEDRPDSLFEVRNIHHLESERDAAELVVCCGVLEQLTDVDLALRNLQVVAERFLVVSAARHPHWSLMNLARGRYWSSFGRAPAHVNHWSRLAFADLVSQYFVVEELLTPLPWTMLLCRAQTDTQVVRHLANP